MANFQLQNGAFTGASSSNIRYVPLTDNGSAVTSVAPVDPSLRLRDEAVRSGMMTAAEADKFFKVSHGEVGETDDFDDTQKRLAIIDGHIEELLHNSKVRKVLQNKELHKELEAGISSVEELSEALKYYAGDDNDTKEHLDELLVWLTRHTNEATTEGPAKELYKKQAIGITRSFLQLGFHNDPYNVIMGLRLSGDSGRPINRLNPSWLTDDKFISRLEKKAKVEIPEEVHENAEKAEATWEKFAEGVAITAGIVAVGALAIAALPVVAAGSAIAGGLATAASVAGWTAGGAVVASLLPSAGNALGGIATNLISPVGNFSNNTIGTDFKPAKASKEWWADAGEDWTQFKQGWSSLLSSDAQYLD